MNGKTTGQDLEMRKLAQSGVKEALEYLLGQPMCSHCMQVQRILRRADCVSIDASHEQRNSGTEK